MSEYGDKIAEIAVGKLENVYDRLDDEGKEMLLAATSSLVDQIIKMSSTTDEEEIAGIRANIGHIKGTIDNIFALVPTSKIGNKSVK